MESDLTWEQVLSGSFQPSPFLNWNYGGESTLYDVNQEFYEDEETAHSPTSDYEESPQLFGKCNDFQQTVENMEGNERADELESLKCPVKGCSRKYKYKGDLKWHIKHKHPSHITLADLISKPRSSKLNKEFPCPSEDCVCGYQRRREWLRHLRQKHLDLYLIHCKRPMLGKVNDQHEISKRLKRAID